ncbi:agmatinase [Aestuariivirga litoralis]|uniref:agmatinase n=1 Tax=Aestuariivirga litoralis TaxID=2650924 RepID=UPI0018C5D6D6|nr:agmatinase [Aestuariivirga litoralis]MBG1232067.1 agmatinase [Aestuariivirga litoralis]
MALELDKLGYVPGDEAFRRENLKGTRWEATYAGALSYMRRKYTRDLKGVDFAITGIPFDQAVSHRSGTRMGPEGIRRASAENAWGPYWPWNFDPFDTLAVVDYGDCFFDWGNKEAFPTTLENHAAEIINQNVELISLGGDHYVSYPLLKAHAKKHGPLALVHFDAHRDVEIDTGGRIDHGTMFGYAVKEGLIDPEHSVQIGIRTTFVGETTMGFRIIYADEVHESTSAQLAKIICDKVGKKKAYLTFDIDCLDPSVAPGTGTPIPGGLSYHQAASIIRKLGPINFIGMDVVEVSPPYDHAELTSMAASALVLEYLCLRAAQKGARAVVMPK